MSELEQDLTLPNISRKRYRDLSHSVPFGAHSFIENKAESGVYYSSCLHSNANHVPLMHRSRDGSARTIKHLTWKQVLADEPSEKDKYATQVKRRKQRYKSWNEAEASYDSTFKEFEDAVEGYYESSEQLRSQRLVVAQSASLSVASDLTQRTIEEIQRDTEFLKNRGNSLHNLTRAVGNYFSEVKQDLEDLNSYIREKTVRNVGAAADDAHNESRAGDVQGRLAVWSAYLRPGSDKLVERAYERSKFLDDQIDYRK